MPEMESWWERLGRMLGGWGVALFALWIFKPRIEDNKMSLPLAFLLLVILGLSMSMAHSTVFRRTMETARHAVPWIKGLIGRGNGERTTGQRRAVEDGE